MTMHGRAVQSPTGPLDIDEELDHVALGNKCMVSEVQYKILTLRQELQEKKPTRLQESSDEADAEPQEEEERATGQVSREAGHMENRRKISSRSKDERRERPTFSSF